MISYDYMCKACGLLQVQYSSYNERDHPKPCKNCKEPCERVFATVPQVRTEKLSRTFVDGIKRPGFEDLKKIADLQVEQLRHRPDSERYRQINQEIQERKKLK